MKGYSLGFYLSHGAFVLCSTEQTDISILSYCREKIGTHSRVSKAGQNTHSHTHEGQISLKSIKTSYILDINSNIFVHPHNRSYQYPSLLIHLNA